MELVTKGFNIIIQLSLFFWFYSFL